MFKKNIFLIIAIAIILSISSWYGYSYIRSKNSSNFRGYDIENGNFFGTSSDGKEYNVRADYITNIGKNFYKLNKIYARYYLDNEKDQFTEVMSATGTFNEEKNLLSLNGDVEFILSQGYRMMTDHFFIDMKKNIAFTKEEVILSGVQGKILSKTGITIYMKKKKIILHGPVQSMFIPLSDDF